MIYLFSNMYKNTSCLHIDILQMCDLQIVCHEMEYPL
jgi:hypothetical protein